MPALPLRSLVVLALLAAPPARAEKPDLDVSFGVGMASMAVDGSFADRYLVDPAFGGRFPMRLRYAGWSLEGTATIAGGAADNGRFARYDFSSFGLHLGRYLCVGERTFGGKEPGRALFELYARAGVESTGALTISDERALGLAWGGGAQLRLVIARPGRAGMSFSVFVDVTSWHVDFPESIVGGAPAGDLGVDLRVVTVGLTMPGFGR